MGGTNELRNLEIVEVDPASREELRVLLADDTVAEDAAYHWLGTISGACNASPVAWLVSDARVLASAEVAGDGAGRRRGLLGRDRIEGAFVIEPCRWVHTIGMRFPLDVAYLDEDGNVLKTVRMARHRIGRPVRGGHWVIEAEAGVFARWNLRVGDVVELRDEDHTGP